MKGKHAYKMLLGIAFSLLLTLQSLRLVSTQTTNPKNGDLNPLPFSGIPVNEVTSLEEDLTISSGSSGDGEYQAGNQTVKAVTEQYDKTSTTVSHQTTMNIISNIIETDKTSIQQNDTNNLVTENPTAEPATTNGSHVNLTETNTTTPSPRNSTTTATTTATNTTNNTTTATFTTAFNITQNPNSTGSKNFSTTSSIPVINYTSPRENSTSTTISTTTTIQTMNRTEGSFDSRGNMDRGLTSDIQQKDKGQAWGAILGIGVGVAIVALVIYVIVKRRNYSDFSHRKLVEDIPHEPVLRLDNSEPLDLKFDGFAYYNPGLQGDNIQMTNFPKGQTN